MSLVVCCDHDIQYQSSYYIIYHNLVWNVRLFLIFLRVVIAIYYRILINYIDGFSQKVIGYALVRTLSSIQIIAALTDAISARDTTSLTHKFCISMQLKP